MTRSKISWLLLVLAIAGLNAAWFALHGRASWRSAEPAGKRVDDFALFAHNGRSYELYQHASAKAIVLFTHGIGCPIVRHAIPTLKALRARYAGQGVDFWLINANPQDDRRALQADAALLDIDLPILKDEAQLVTQRLEAMRTGEAILIDPETWTVRYRGPVDDRVHYEAQKPEARAHYLEDAIQAVIRGEKVERPRVTAPGCIISFDADPDERNRPVSYAGDVVPILREKCVACHRPGGIGPWAMEDYRTVKGWSSMMREVILNRRMPPWHADPAIGRFSPDRSLTPAQQRTLIRWIDAGAPGPDGSDVLAQNPPPPVAEWPLGPPDLVLTVPKQTIPASGVQDYRYVKIPVPLDGDRWIRAVDLKPGNRAVMHHAFAFVGYPESSKSRQPRWNRGLNGFLAGYVPGYDVLPYPEDSGQLLPAGAAITFQLHYTPVGYPAEDEPKLALYFHEKQPALEYKVGSVYNMAIRIPPHAAEHEESAAGILRTEATLYAFFPHMHLRGKRFRYDVTYPDGARETLLSIPRYNFNWQNLYRLETPKTLPAGSRIEVTADFDNSASNPANPDPSKEVLWGLQSWNEMLVGYYFYTQKRAGAAHAAAEMPAAKPANALSNATSHRAESGAANRAVFPPGAKSPSPSTG